MKGQFLIVANGHECNAMLTVPFVNFPDNLENGDWVWLMMRSQNRYLRCRILRKEYHPNPESVGFRVWVVPDDTDGRGIKVVRKENEQFQIGYPEDEPEDGGYK